MSVKLISAPILASESESECSRRASTIVEPPKAKKRRKRRRMRRCTERGDERRVRRPVSVEVEFVRLSPLWMAELSKQMSLERFVFPFFSLHFISFLLSQYLVFFIYKPHP
jgi:hypothetical protein